MIGMTLRVEMLDGETHEAPITYGVAFVPKEKPKQDAQSTS
jgi:hypothetical protein